jgi:Helix-turn-helix of DDE superfamily endonuclease
MRYKTVQTLKDEEFKRSTGVQRGTFEKMLEVVETGLRNFGRPAKLSRADQLLLTLMYWREYRTEFHIGLTYSVSEATVCRTIKKVENVLIKSKQFHLPGKKALQPDDTVIEIVLIDATEQPIERPKKDNAGITVATRSGTPKKHS